MAPFSLAYCSFDVVPAPKGAAVHIEAFVRLLSQAFGTIQLVTVAAESAPLNHPGIEHHPLPASGPTLIHRVMHFRQQLRHWLTGKHFSVIHIRSIYEGFPIAVGKATWCDRLVFEVNGLPSIELPYRYPDVAEDRELLHKLTMQEQVCLDAADVIITPSPVTRDYLVRRQVTPAKIHVIPNGVDLAVFSYHSPRLYVAAAPGEAFEVCYFGTLSRWQGVDLAVRAIAQVQSQLPARLTLIGPASQLQVRSLNKLATKLGVRDRVRRKASTTQAELVQQLHQSHCTIAPLTACDRNLVQGCCPLKVLEGMASGTPVIASDLPVVQALGTANTHFIPVKPGSVTALAAAFQHIAHQPDLVKSLAVQARHQVETRFTWTMAGQALIETYRSLAVF